LAIALFFTRSEDVGAIFLDGSKGDVMQRAWSRTRLVPAIIAGALLLVMGGCYRTYTTGPFRDVANLETRLQKGISSPADVRSVMGEPDGTGKSLFPVDHNLRDIWVYYDLTIGFNPGSGSRRSPSGEITGYNAMAMQRILVIFFSDNHFDGFLWFDDTVTPAIY
jgi:hypothetical protein